MYFFCRQIHHFEFGDEIVAVVVGDKAQLVALRGIDRVIVQIAPIHDQFAFAFAGFLNVALNCAVLLFDMRLPVAVELFGRYASGFFERGVEVDNGSVFKNLPDDSGAKAFAEVVEHGESLIIDHFAVEIALAAELPHAGQGEQIIFERGHSQEHIAVCVPVVVAVFGGFVLRDAFGKPRVDGEVIQAKRKAEIGIFIGARGVDDANLEWQALIGGFQCYDVGEFMDKNIAYPVASAADFPVDGVGPEVDVIRAVHGKGIAQIIRLIVNDDVDGRNAIHKGGVMAHEIREDIIAEVGNLAGGFFGCREVDIEISGANHFRASRTQSQKRWEKAVGCFGFPIGVAFLIGRRTVQRGVGEVNPNGFGGT